MQHGEEPALGASINRVRPRIGAFGFGMARQVKDVNHAVPDRFTGPVEAVRAAIVAEQRIK
jgi:hypothetical protein